MRRRFRHGEIHIQLHMYDIGLIAFVKTILHSHFHGTAPLRQAKLQRLPIGILQFQKADGKVVDLCQLVEIGYNTCNIATLQGSIQHVEVFRLQVYRLVIMEHGIDRQQPLWDPRKVKIPCV